MEFVRLRLKIAVGSYIDLTNTNDKVCGRAWSMFSLTWLKTATFWKESVRKL